MLSILLFYEEIPNINYDLSEYRTHLNALDLQDFCDLKIIAVLKMHSLG